MRSSLDPGLPAIVSLIYAPGDTIATIIARLDSTPSQPITGALFQGSPSGTPMTSSLSLQNLVRLQINPALLDPGRQYVVALALDPKSPSWGPGVVLVFQQPSLTAINVRNELVEIGWLVQAPTSIDAVRAELYDVTNNVVVVRETSAAAGVRLVPPAPLNPSGNYVVRAMGVNGVASGPVVTSDNLILTAPTVASVAYGVAAGGSGYALTVTASSAPVTGSTLNAQLYCDGVAVGPAQQSSGATVSLALTRPLDPRSRWHVRLFLQRGIVSGPAGVPHDVTVPALPAIASLLYAAGRVVATFDAPATPAATMALFKGAPSGTGWLASTSTSTSNATLTIDPSNLDPLSAYTVALTLDPTATPVVWERAVQLVFQPPTLTAASLARDAVHVAWTLPTTTSIAAVVATLYDQTSQAPVATATASGSGVRLPLPAPLDPTHSYNVNVVGVNGVASGPIVRSPSLILFAPAIASAVYAAGTPGTWTVTVTAAQTPSPPGTVIARLLSDGMPIVEAAASGAAAVLTVSRQLEPASRWQVVLSYRAAIISGPPGVAVDVPTASPELVAAEFDGARFSVAWTPPVGLPGATGAAVSIRRSADGTEIGSARVPAGTYAEITPTGPVQPNAGYEAVLAPILGCAAGLFGAGTVLLVAPPTLTQVKSDGAQVGVALSGVAAPARGTRLLLTTGGVELSSAAAGMTGGFLPLPPGAPMMAALTIAARATGRGLVGPPSAAAPVVLATPRFSNVVFGNGVVTGNATVPAGLPYDVATVAVMLYADGVPLASRDTAADGWFSIPVAAAAGAALSLRAMIGGPTNGVVVAAPLSSPAPVLTVAPVIVTASLVAGAGGQWQVSATWSMRENGNVSCFAVALVQSNQALKTWTVTGSTFSAAAPAFSAASELTLVVTPLGVFGSGPASSAATFLAAAPAIAGVQCDGTTVSARWAASVGGMPTAYRLRLVRARAGAWETIAQSDVVSGTAAAVALSAAAADTSAAYGLTIDVAVGPAWTAANAITTVPIQPPILTAAGFDAATGALTVTWSAIASTVDYAAELRNATGAVVQRKVKATTVTLAAAELPSSGVYDARVQPIASDVVLGPWSTAVAVAIVAPLAVRVAYDGRQARVSWQPVTASAVTGYLVTVMLDATEKRTQWTTSTSAVLDVAFDAATSPTVFVQAMTSAGAGQPSAAVPLFQAGWYCSSRADQAPHVVPATAPAMAPYDVTVYLPDIFKKKPTQGLPTPAPFVLAVAPPSAAPFAYTLTMPKASIVWAFGVDPLRPNVRTAYEALIDALIGLQVTSMGLRAVQDAIARAMPQTFAETLLYGSGCDPANSYVDLTPGMVLRVEYQSYQYLGPGQSEAVLLDGFVATNTAEYQIASYVDPSGTWLTGFDAFLSRITTQGSVVPPPATTQGGAAGGGGIIDLYYRAFQQPFCRVVYPPTLLRNTDSDPRPEFNVAILAADDYRILRAATQSLRNAQPLGSGVAVTYLRGRTVVTACVRVMVDGVPLVVPVGTTIANLLESLGRRPPVLSGLPLSGVTVTRARGAAITDQAAATAGYPASSGVPIALGWLHGFVYNPTTDWLSLPLLAGDRLSTTETG